MSIEENIRRINEKLPDNISLVSVSKTRSIEEIKEAYRAGARDFGENKVQELVDKYDSFDSSVRWHLLGHLQTNKVKYIVGKVFLIHSLDSIKLLEEIEKRYKAQDEVANVLIQINIGKEESKTGIYEEEVKELILAAGQCTNVKVKGLMAVIPKGSDEQCRNYFRKMKTIWEKIKNESYKNVSMDYLSMGMTHDYKLALLEGSNMIRVGEGIFGKRNYNNK